MEGLLNLGLNAWLAQVMYLFAEIKQLTQYMQSECFFNDFSIMNSAILLKVVSFIVYSWVSSVNSVLLSKHTLYTFYSKERVFSTLYFVFEILLILRVIVLKTPSKMSQLLKSGSEFHSIEKWHFLHCPYFSAHCKICFWVSMCPQVSAYFPVWPLTPLSNFCLHCKYVIYLRKV